MQIIDHLVIADHSFFSFSLERIVRDPMLAAPNDGAETEPPLPSLPHVQIVLPLRAR